MTEPVSSPPAELRRRYLTEFRPGHIAHRFTDVLVVGSGVAGLSAALAAASDPAVEVTVVTKSELKESATHYAQGGVAAVLAPERTGDSAEEHIRDTLEVAGGIASEEAVRTTVTEGIERVRELIGFGAAFDAGPDGSPASTREGGHSYPRIVHRGDTTGQAVEETLLDEVRRRPNIRSLEHTFAIDLLGNPSVCRGSLVFRRKELEAVWARRTVLATGGAGCLYRETTNPSVCTGDGISIAYRAGASIQDLEFVQFHPTTLYLAGVERFLITEAARGEGGVLRDSRGDAFMGRFHAMADLAPRDVVSRAIVHVMKERGENRVWLDLGGIPPERIERRFPYILEICNGFGIDIRREPIPVRPSAHYSVGGVATDLYGRTSLDGLFAAGEVACTGLHGANRLASNSILEGLVFGHRAGRQAAAASKNVAMPSPYDSDLVSTNGAFEEERGEGGRHRAGPGAEFRREDLLSSLRSLMWYDVGLEREGRRLQQAIEQLRSWIVYALGADFHSPAGWSLQNMLETAYLTALLAFRREESRGVHYRSDFPALDDANWKRHQQVSIQSLWAS